MSNANQKRPCIQCKSESTRAVSGVCWRCRPAPPVHPVGDSIEITGIGHLGRDQALRLAWAISDALDSPAPGREHK